MSTVSRRPASNSTATANSTWSAPSSCLSQSRALLTRYRGEDREKQRRGQHRDCHGELEASRDGIAAISTRALSPGFSASSRATRRLAMSRRCSMVRRSPVAGARGTYAAARSSSRSGSKRLGGASRSGGGLGSGGGRRSGGGRAFWRRPALDGRPARGGRAERLAAPEAERRLLARLPAAVWAFLVGHCHTPRSSARPRTLAQPSFPTQGTPAHPSFRSAGLPMTVIPAQAVNPGAWFPDANSGHRRHICRPRAGYAKVSAGGNP